MPPATHNSNRGREGLLGAHRVVKCIGRFASSWPSHRILSIGVGYVPGIPSSVAFRRVVLNLHSATEVFRRANQAHWFSHAQADTTSEYGSNQDRDMQISHLSGSAEEKRMTFWRYKLTKLLSTIMGGDVVSICVCAYSEYTFVRVCANRR